MVYYHVDAQDKRPLSETSRRKIITGVEAYLFRYDWQVNGKTNYLHFINWKLTHHAVLDMLVPCVILTASYSCA